MGVKANFILSMAALIIAIVACVLGVRLSFFQPTPLSEEKTPAMTEEKTKTYTTEEKVKKKIVEEIEGGKMTEVGILWAVLALIAFLAAYYVQIINRLFDIEPKDKRRTAKYYWTRTLLSWMVVSLFFAIFTIALKVCFLPLIYRRVVIIAFLVSQGLHVFVFLWSYGTDLIGKAKTREGYWEDGIYVESE